MDYSIELILRGHQSYLQTIRRSGNRPKRKNPLWNARLTERKRYDSRRYRGLCFRMFLRMHRCHHVFCSSHSHLGYGMRLSWIINSLNLHADIITFMIVLLFIFIEANYTDCGHPEWMEVSIHSEGIRRW